jgi:hypothetical protein
MTVQVLPNAVDNKMKQLVLLVQEEGNSQIANLLFRIFRGWYEVYSFEVTKIDFEPVDVNVEKLFSVRDEYYTIYRIHTLQTYFFLEYPSNFPSAQISTRLNVFIHANYPWTFAYRFVRIEIEVSIPEDRPYICQFLVDPLLLQFSRSCISQVCNEFYQTW